MSLQNGKHGQMDTANIVENISQLMLLKRNRHSHHLARYKQNTELCIKCSNSKCAIFYENSSFAFCFIDELHVYATRKVTKHRSKTGSVSRGGGLCSSDLPKFLNNSLKMVQDHWCLGEHCLSVSPA